MSAVADREKDQTTIELSLENTVINTASADLSDMTASVGRSMSIQVACKDLTTRITIKSGKIKSKKTILDGVTAAFRPGRLTAVMGASGAGKTTLLSALAGQVGDSKVQGTVEINGTPVSPRELRQISGFVFQDDVLMDTMTVGEAVAMSARLRLSDKIPLEGRLKRADQVIELLGLTEAKNTRIGSPQSKGISGGERKRTSLAMEMVTNPAVLFLDEPTSGLDTHTAFSVVSSLSELAKQGRTIIATIHQPSSEIFHLFDDLLLLADGQVVYYGSVADSVAYFASHGFNCPTYTNPADFFFMEVLNRPTKIVDSSGPATLIAAWKASLARDALDLLLADSARDTIATSQIKVHAGFASQFSLLFVRARRNALRNVMFAPTMVMRAIMMGLLLGLIYMDIGNRDVPSQIQDRSGALAFLGNNQIMSGSMSIVPIFIMEKAIFAREFRAGYYRLPAYFFSKVLVELPFVIAGPLLATAISYYLIGLQPALSKFLIAILANVLAGLTGSAIGILAASIFSNFGMVMAFLPMILLPLMLFGGLMINLATIPWYFRWIKHISPMKYSFTALAQNEFTGLVFTNCDPSKQRCDGGLALEMLKMDQEPSLWANLTMMLLMYLLLMVASYCALHRASIAKNK